MDVALTREQSAVEAHSWSLDPEHRVRQASQGRDRHFNGCSEMEEPVKVCSFTRKFTSRTNGDTGVLQGVRSVLFPD